MNSKPQTDIAKWFAVRVKSRCEKIVASIAQNKGFEGFVPLYQSRRPWSDRFKAGLNPQRCLPLLTIPGVLHLAGNGRVPVPIDETEIAAIRTVVSSGLATEPWSFLEVGQRVRLESGPLTGIEGILVETSDRHRVVVSVTLLKRSVAVAVERHWAMPIMAESPLC
jgi:transcription antitermination factor NusG